MHTAPLEDHHHTGEPLAWKQAADDVFVATHGGEYAGFVEVDGRRHIAHDRRGRRVGDFASLASALAALESPGSRRPARRARRRTRA